MTKLSPLAKSIAAIYAPGVAFTAQQAIVELGAIDIKADNPQVIAARAELVAAGHAEVDMKRGFVLLKPVRKQG